MQAVGRARWSWLLRSTMAGCAVLVALGARANADHYDGLWERGRRTFEAEDRKYAPGKNGVVFVGSSSIRLWATRAFFPALSPVNRGLSGSRISDATRYLDRIVLPYEPKVIVFYAGDNDIAGGASPEVVLFDFNTFVEVVHGKLSSTRILFLSIKPSPVRRELWGRMQEANRMIELLCAGDDRLRYVDVATAMLDAEGNPRRELFLEDGLHMNPLGYRLWTEVVSPVVEQALQEL